MTSLGKYWKMSEETKKKISETLKRKGLKYGKLNAMYGCHHSEQTKEKLSSALTGRKRIFSEEHRKHLSEALKGRRHSVETRRKMSGLGKNRIKP